MTKNLLLDAAILLGLAILGVIGYKLAPLLSPKADIALALSSCDLNQRSCTADLPDGGQLEFSIEPRPVPSLKPLQLRATVSGTEVRRIEVDFAGSEMKMGYNRPQLVSEPGDKQRFSGQASLPVCITGSMQWDVTVLVDTGKALVAVPFRLQTSN
ncbi:hypothetical protein [Candidatus Accumulibacter sp. ACC007]|uniref:hypothetical protein n=1 Tax=Candidatus Accumulibacter sp. ACC007 TaxID=2823333 RepID=UPI0025C122F4|nr:hypothetical protein [Candidatus Accumulibacter sp. ACC007]